jgi:hypothetical protein
MVEVGLKLLIAVLTSAVCDASKDAERENSCSVNIWNTPSKMAMG